MSSITIDSLDDGTLRCLKEEARRRGLDLSTTAGELLKERFANVSSVGQPGAATLGSLAGTWTEQDEQEFRAATTAFEQIDQELWR